MQAGTPPPTGSAASRPRLLTRLDSAEWLAIVWGPAGYGKSTLISAWLSTRRPRRTVHVDESNDVPLDGLWSGISRQILEDEDMVLVLDRADLVADVDLGRRLHELHGTHPGLRVIVALRHAGLLWSYGLPRPDVGVISPVELQFTADELSTLFADNGLPLTARTARDVLHHTGAQPVLIDRALRIGRLFGSRNDIEWPGAFQLFHDACDGFVDTTLGSAAAAALRESALALAPMTRVTVGAASALEIDNAHDVLDALEHAGLVARLPHPTDLQWAFPAAIRASLLRQAAAREPQPSDAIADAAHWLARTESPVDALQFAKDAQAWELAAELITAHWLTIGLISLEVLTEALTELPGEIVAANPALFYGRELAVAMGPTRTGEPPRPVDPDGRRQFEPMLTTSQEIRALAEEVSAYHAVLCATLRSVFYRWRGDYAEAVRHNDVAAELSHGPAEHTGVEAILLPVLWLHLGESSHLHDDQLDAARFFQLAIDGSAGPPFDFAGRQAAGQLAFLLAGQLAFLLAVQGETHQSQRWIERESEYGENPGWLGPVAAIPAQTSKVLTALDRLDLAAAVAAAEALPNIEDSVEYWSFVVYSRCQLDLVRGNSAIALDRLHRVTSAFEKRMAPGSLAAALLGAAEMDLRVALGDAAEVAARAGTPEQQMHPMARVAAARACLLSGDPTTALEHCRQLTGRRPQHTRIRVEALLIEAAALLHIADEQRARGPWDRAVALAENTGLVRPFAGVPPAERRLLSSLGAPAPGPALHWGSDIFPAPVTPVTLTKREAAVLAALNTHGNAAQIAETLFVSPNTVKSQLRTLYRKLGAHSRDEAMEAARLRGLL